MDITPNIAPNAPEKPAAEAAPQAAPQTVKACPKKKSCGAIILILALLACAGAGASAFFYLDNHNQSQEISKLKNTISTYESSQKDSAVDNAMIQSLVDPYLISFGSYYSVFETGLTEEAKVSIAAFNIGMQRLENRENTETHFQDFLIYYPNMNSMYKKLFGSDKDVAKKNFNSIHNISYDSEHERYVLPPAAYGGAGAITVTKIKDFTISPDEIVVEMYHDNVAFCELLDDTVEEVEVKKKSYCISYASSETPVDDFLKEHEEELPVYTFEFKKDTGYEDYEYKDGRFVLKNLEKTSE